jgi:hypothetical protein
MANRKAHPAAVFIFPLGSYPDTVPSGMFCAARQLSARGIAHACVDLNRFFFNHSLDRFCRQRRTSRQADFARPMHLTPGFAATASGRSFRAFVASELGDRFRLTSSLCLDTAAGLTDFPAAIDALAEEDVPEPIAQVSDFLQRNAAVAGAREILFSVALPSQVFWAIFSALRLRRCFPHASISFGGASWRYFIAHPRTDRFAQALCTRAGLDILASGTLLGAGQAAGARRPSLVRMPGTHKNAAISFELGLGCAYGRCTFCSFPSIQEAPTSRSDSLPRKVRQLRFLITKYKPSKIFIADAYVPPPTLAHVLPAIGAHRLSGGLSCFVRFDPAFSSHELTSRLYALGLREVFVGLESANAQVLELMQKGIDLAVAVENLASFKHAGIRVRVSVMLGFPTETRQAALETLAFLRKHRQDIPERPAVFKFGLDAGTPLADRPDDFMITDIRAPANVFYPVSTASSRNGMTPAEVKQTFDEIQEALDDLYPPDRGEHLNVVGEQTDIVSGARLL